MLVTKLDEYFLSKSMNIKVLLEVLTSSRFPLRRILQTFLEGIEYVHTYMYIMTIYADNSLV